MVTCKIASELMIKIVLNYLWLMMYVRCFNAQIIYIRYFDEKIYNVNFLNKTNCNSPLDTQAIKNCKLYDMHDSEYIVYVNHLVNLLDYYF